MCRTHGAFRPHAGHRGVSTRAMRDARARIRRGICRGVSRGESQTPTDARARVVVRQMTRVPVRV